MIVDVKAKDADHGTNRGRRGGGRGREVRWLGDKQGDGWMGE